jgi:hypothetical protein
VDVLNPLLFSQMGLYLFGDNDPFHVEANLLIGRLFGADLALKVMLSLSLSPKFLLKHNLSRVTGLAVRPCRN